MINLSEFHYTKSETKKEILRQIGEIDMLTTQQFAQLEQMGLMKEVKRLECKDHLKRGQLQSEVMLEYGDGTRKIATFQNGQVMVSTGTGLTTVADYFVRGNYGKSSYRGNCTGLLVKDLLEYFRPNFFMDLCKGSGTAEEVANELGIPNYCTDLYEGNDLLKDTPPFRSDFIWLHPPYYVPAGSSMPKYSGSQWGTMAHPSDGSHLTQWDDFMKWFNQFVARGYENLVAGGRLAILVGDTRYKGKLYSPFKEMNIYGEMEHVIIKTQHNTWGDRQNYSGRFIPIAHEYLIILKKPSVMEIPMTTTQKLLMDFRQSLKISWKNLIAKYIEAAGGQLSRQELATLLTKHPKAQTNNHVEAKMRQVINTYTQLFQQQNGMVSLTPLAQQLVSQC